VHAAAQACKTKWQENPKDTKKLEECKKLYATSAELYEKFLAAYPNSKRSYEFSAFYADALYYSGQLKQAISAYKNVPRLAAGQPVPGRRRLPDDQDVRRAHRGRRRRRRRSTIRRSPTRRTPSRPWSR
jgi:tetratricopeptide (TPR) repeat protein